MEAPFGQIKTVVIQGFWGHVTDVQIFATAGTVKKSNSYYI
jgi:hypothetical protein